MRKTLSLGIAATLVAASFAVAGAPAQGAPRSGELVSATELHKFATRADVDAYLTSDNFDPGTDRYGVRTYRLVYRTTSATGKPTTASGLVALPLNGARRLSTVEFGHGTEIYRKDAPSTSDDVFLTGPATTFASAGFAAVAPDYLGLGLGPGEHPWMDVPSETTASLDLLRAARTFVSRQGRSLNREVYLSGFSQGASAALSLARALQGDALQGDGDPWFRAAAVAPISGAYDFRDAAIPSLFTPEVNPLLASAYTTYLLTAYDRLHDIYRDPADVFQPDYLPLAGMFDGRHTGQEVLGALPASIDDLLTARGRAMLLHPTGRFADALAVLDSVCTDWTPRMPMRLYYSPGDEEAVNANTWHCRAALKAPTVDLGVDKDYNGFVHEGSEVLGVPQVTRWFAQLAS